MADGSIKIDTKILGDKFDNDIAKIKRSLLALTGIMSAFGLKSISVGKDFEKSMSQVGATMGLTVDEIRSGTGAFSELTKAAREAGKNTEWSASEAAQALNYMALAGYNAEQSISTLPTVLNLATAGGLELARASDMITDAMSALGLELSNAGDFADVLVKASQKANASVGEFGEAILTVGGTARILKGGVNELTSALGVLANAGYKGAEGGTVLRNVILSLTAPTSMAQKEFEKLGVSAFDSLGNMRGLQDIINDLNDSLKDLSQQEREDVLNKIFNRREIGAVKLLMADINKGFVDLQGNLQKAKGSAEQTAKVMQDNLAGSLKSLKSKFEDLSITIYNNVGPALKYAVDGMGEFISELSDSDEINNFSNAIQNIILAFTQLVQQILPIVIVLFNRIGDIIGFISDNAQGLIISFVAIKSAIIGMKIATLSFAGAWKIVRSTMISTGVGALIVALGWALQKIIDNIQEIIIWTKIGWESLKNFIANIFTDTDKYANRIKELREELQKVKEESKDNMGFDGERIKKGLDELVKGMNSFGNATKNAEQKMSGFKTPFDVELTEEQLKNINKLTEQTESFGKIFDKTMINLATSSQASFESAFTAITDGFEDVGEALVNGESGWKAFKKAGVMAIASVVDALSTQIMAQAVAEYLKSDYGKASMGFVQASSLKLLSGVLKAGAGRFENGGIVGGSSYSGDKLTANVNSGELILNMAQQENLAKMLLSKANTQPMVNIQVINNTNSQVGIQQDELNNIKILIDTEINQYMTGSKGEKMLSSNYGIRKVGIR